MAKTFDELDRLEKATTRSEQYLSHITGRSQDLALLPKPESRHDEYLEYLCYNGIGGGGGGGGVPFVGLTNASLRDDKIVFDKNNGTTVTVDLKDFAMLGKENVFTKENTFPDVLIGGIKYDNRDLGNVGTDTANRYFGMRNQSSKLFHNGYVESLRFYISNQGATQYINSVSVWAVTKGQDIAADTVARQVVTNQRFNINPAGANAQLPYIEVPIEEAFADDTYFVAFLQGTSGNQFQAINQVPQQLRNEYVNMSVAPVIGGRVENEGNRAFCVYSEIRGRISVKEELLKKPTGGTAGVSDVTYDPVTKELSVTTNGVVAKHSLSDLVDVTDVRYDNGTKKLIVEKQGGVPVEYDLDGLMTSINNVDPQNGNINLELNIVNDEIVLSANGNEIQKTSLNGYVKRDELTTVGGAGNQDKVPQLGADGKLSGTMMPDLAITQVVDVTSQQEALDKIASGDIQVGDVVVVDPNNEIYMYNGTPAGGTFEDSFVQLSLGDGTVKEVNGQRPVANGQVVVESEHIPYNKQTSNLQADNVQAAIDEVVTQLNSRAEDITNTGTELQLLGKNNVVLGRVQLMTQQEVTNIIDQFI